MTPEEEKKKLQEQQYNQQNNSANEVNGQSEDPVYAYQDDKGNKYTQEQYDNIMARHNELTQKYGEDYVEFTDGSAMSRSDYDSKMKRHNDNVSKYGEDYVEFADGTAMSRADYGKKKKEYDDYQKKQKEYDTWLKGRSMQERNAIRHYGMMEKNSENANSFADLPQEFIRYQKEVHPGINDKQIMQNWWNAKESSRKGFVSRAMDDDMQYDLTPNAEKPDYNVVVSEYENQRKQLENMRKARTDANGDRYVPKSPVEGGKVVAGMSPVDKVYIDKVGNEYGSADEAYEEDSAWEHYEYDKKVAEEKAIANIPNQIDELLLDANRGFSQDITDQAIQRNVFRGHYGLGSNTTEEERQNRYAALSIQMLNEAKENIQLVKEGGGNFFGGLKDAILNSNTWSMGIAELSRANIIYSLKEKLGRKEKLTKNEETLVKTLALYNAVISGNEDNISAWYNAGKITGEMVPFMIEMALNPTSGASGAVGKTVAKGLSKELSKIIAKKVAGELTEGAAKIAMGRLIKGSFGTAAKTLGAKAAGAIVENTLSSAGLAATLQSMKVAAGALENYNGQASFVVGKDGKYEFGGFQGGEGFGSALLHSYGRMFTENFSEGVGGWFAPVLKTGGGVMMKVLGKNGKPLQHLITKLGNTKAAKAFDKFFEKTKYDGLVGEFLEEKVGDLMHQYITRDEVRDNDEFWKSFFDGEDNAELLLSLAPVSIIGGTASGINYEYSKHKLNKAMADADRNIMQRITTAYNEGTEEYNASVAEWEKQKEMIDNAKEGDFANILRGLVATSKDTPIERERKEAVANYVIQVYNKRIVDGLYAADAALLNPRQQKAVFAMEQAEREGYEAETEEARKNLAMRMDAADAAMSKYFGEDSDSDEMLTMYGNTPEEQYENVVNDNNMPSEQRQALLKYMEARFSYDAMISQAQGEVQKAGELAGNAVDRITNKESGQVVEIKMHGSNETGHVIGGKLDDGAVMVQFADGSQRMVGRSMFDVTNITDASEMRQQEVDAAKENAARAIELALEAPTRVSAQEQPMQIGDEAVANVNGKAVRGIVSKADSKVEGQAPSVYEIEYTDAEGKTQKANVSARNLYVASSVDAEAQAIETSDAEYAERGVIADDGADIETADDEAVDASNTKDQTLNDEGDKVSEVSSSTQQKRKVEIPTDENGIPMYESVPVEDTVESWMQTGFATEDLIADAQHNIDNAVAEQRKAEENAKKVMQSRPSSEVADPISRKQAQDAWRSEMDAAEAEVEKQKGNVRYWLDVKNGISSRINENKTVGQRMLDAANSIDEIEDPTDADVIELALRDMDARKKAADRDGAESVSGLCDLGLTVSQIAERDGISEDDVYQRMADRNMTDVKTLKAIDSIAKKMHMSVQFRNWMVDETGKHLVNAFVDRESRTIYVSRNSIAKGNGVDFLLGHEFTHQLKADMKGDISQFMNLAKQILGVEEFNRRLASKMRAYSGIMAARNNDASKIYDDMVEEVVADFAGELFANTDLIKKAAGMEPSMLEKIVDALKKLFAMFMETGSEADIRKKIELAQEAWNNALFISNTTTRDPKNIESSRENRVDYSIDTLCESVGLRYTKDADGMSRFTDNMGQEIGEITTEYISSTPIGVSIESAVYNGYISQDDAAQQRQFLADLFNEVLKTNDLDMVFAVSGALAYGKPAEEGRLMDNDDRGRFHAITRNSDDQYQTTFDVTTVCLKTKAIVDAMSETMMRLKRGLTPEEIVNVVFDETVRAGETVPCPVCYVFSRWVGNGKILQNIKQWQEETSDLSEEEMMGLATALYDRITDMQAELLKKKGNASRSDAKAALVNVDLNRIAEITGISKGVCEKMVKDGHMRELLDQAVSKLEYKEINAMYNTRAQKGKSGRGKGKEVLMLTENEKQDLVELMSDMELIDMYAWLTKARLNLGNDGKKLDNGYEYTPVPDEVLFDLNAGKAFAENYPTTWAYRTSRGPSAGKAITPYAPEHFGDTLAGLEAVNDRNGKSESFLEVENGGWGKTSITALERSRAKMRAQNLIGGQRMQSTSDFRPEYFTDYLIELFELQALGGKVQLYTKVPEAVGMLASSGAEVNCSLMPFGDGWRAKNGATKEGIEADMKEIAESGDANFDEYIDNLISNDQIELRCSRVTGMDERDAFRFAEMYDSAQPIMVCVNDVHMRMCLADPRITFIIPYHASGGTQDNYKSMMLTLGETIEERDDYSPYQSDFFEGRGTSDIWKARVKILTGESLSKPDKDIIRSFSVYDSDGNKVNVLHDLYKRLHATDIDGNVVSKSEAQRLWGDVDVDPECYGVTLDKKQAGHVFPYEYWDRSSTIDTAYKNGEFFCNYAESMGMKPRFSGYAKGADYNPAKDFTSSEGYWKLLIDRSMYNADGTYHTPKTINVSNMNRDFVENVTKRDEGKPTKIAGESSQDFSKRFLEWKRNNPYYQIAPGEPINTPSRPNDPSKTKGIADASVARINEGVKYSIPPEYISEEKDQEGRSFILNEDGTTNFGYVSKYTGLTSAPIKLSEGYDEVDSQGRHHGYGLKHIEEKHGEQIRNAGFNSVREFVDFVSKHYDPNEIRKSSNDPNAEAYMVSLTDRYKNTLFIELSKDDSYWNVKSGGVFRKNYGNNRELVTPLPAVEDTNVSGGAEVQDATKTDNLGGNSSETISDGKVSELSYDEQINFDNIADYYPNSNINIAKREYPIAQKKLNGVSVHDALYEWYRDSGMPNLPTDRFAILKRNTDVDAPAAIDVDRMKDYWDGRGDQSIKVVLSNYINGVKAAIENTDNSNEARAALQGVLDDAIYSYDYYKRAAEGDMKVHTELNEPRYSIADTEGYNFKRWFGDWQNDPENASKVVDNEGKPLVVYHGSSFAWFSEFDNEYGMVWATKDKTYAETYASDLDYQLYERIDGEDAYVINDSKRFEKEGLHDKGIYSVYMSLKNPIELGNIEETTSSESFKSIASKLGMSPEELVKRTLGIWSFDYPIYEITRTKDFANLLLEKGYDGAHAIEGHGSESFAVIDNTQIKSATDNNGEYDPNNADIRYSLDTTKVFGAPYTGSKNGVVKKLIDVLPEGERFVDLFSGGCSMAHGAMLSEKYGNVHVNDVRPIGQQLFLDGIDGKYAGYDAVYDRDGFKEIAGTPESLLWSFGSNGRSWMGDNTERVASRTRRVKELEKLQPLREMLTSSESDYRDVEIMPGDVLYADIPYKDTDNSAYGDAGKFNYKAFSKWASELDQPVYVSSRVAPEGFTEIWSAEKRGFKAGQNETEKLFVQDKFADVEKKRLHTDNADTEAQSTRKEGEDLLSYAERVAKINYENNDASMSSITEIGGDAPVKYSIVEDPDMLEKLNNDPEGYVEMYCSMAKIDGKYYSPMATMEIDENGNKKIIGNGLKIGDWDMATAPDIYDENGNIDEGKVAANPHLRWKVKKDGERVLEYQLLKPNGKPCWAAYNPYEHSTSSPLNDQFAEAYQRPELVLMRVRIPKSDFLPDENGNVYHVEGAKDGVGEIPWKSGKLSNYLKKYGKERKVTLSKHRQIVGELSAAEEAKAIADFISGTDAYIPINVVRPQLREELMKLGVPFGETYGTVAKANKPELDRILNEYNNGNGGSVKYSIYKNGKGNAVVSSDKGNENWSVEVIRQDGETEDSYNNRVKKAQRVAKLRFLPTNIHIEKEDYDGKYDSKTANRWIRDNVRGDYTINDTNEIVRVSRKSAGEVTSHGMHDEAHLKSISKIPEIINNAIFIDEEINTKNNGKFDSYKYYVTPLTIDGEDYTAKVVVGVKNGMAYYDHRLTDIEKGRLIDSLNGITTSVADNDSSNFESKDTRLNSVLQINPSKSPSNIQNRKTDIANGTVKYSIADTRSDNFKKWFGDWENDPENASKVVNEDGTPKIVHHASSNYGFTIFDTHGERTNDKSNVGSHFGSKDVASEFGDEDSTYNVYLDIKKPWETYDFFADALQNAYIDAMCDLKNKANNAKVDRIFERVKDVYPQITDHLLKEAEKKGFNTVFDNDEILEDSNMDGRLYQEVWQEHRNALVDILKDMLKAGGYDGIKYENWYEGKGGDTECWIALEPEQIKSADNNNGEFDGSNPDIRYSLSSEYPNASREWLKAYRELSGDADAINTLKDLEPKTISEVAAQTMLGAKMLWKDEGEGQYRKKGVRSMLGWSEGERRKFQPLLSNNGITPAQMGEMVEQACRDANIPYDTDDANAGLNAVIDVLQGAGSSYDVRHYIEQRRVDTARDNHDAWVQAFEHDRDQEYIRRYGMTYDEYSDMMESHVQGVVPDERPKMPERMDGESTLDYAARIDAWRKAASRYDSKNPMMESDEEARKALIEQVKDQLKSEHVGQMDKRTLTSLMNRLNETDAKNLPTMLDEARRLVNYITMKAVRRNVNNLLRFQVSKRNQKNQSVARAVDDKTRKIFEGISASMKDIQTTGVEDKMHDLRSENWYIRNNARMEGRDLLPHEQSKIDANNEELRKLKEERAKLMVGNMSKGVSDVTDALNKMMEKSLDLDYEWTEADDIELAKLHVLKQMFEGEKALADARDIASQISSLQKEIDDANARIDELDNIGRELTEEEMREREYLENNKPGKAIRIRGLRMLVGQAEQSYIDAMNGMEELLSGTIQDGRLALQAELEEERERKREVLHGSIHDVSGTRSEVNVQDHKNNSKLPGWKRLFTSALSSFEYMAQRIATRTLGKDGFFYKHFVEGNDGVVAANNNYFQRMHDSMTELNEKCKEIFGHDMDKEMSKRSKVVKRTGVYINKAINPEDYIREEQPMSIDTASYIWALWRQEDGKAKLMNMGFDDESIEQIEDFIGMKNIEYMTWLQDEFLQELRIPYNEVYKARNHTSLAEIKNYFPIRVASGDRQETVSLEEMGGYNQGSINLKTGSSVNRTHNTLEIDLSRGAFDVLMEHVDEVNDFISYDKVRQELGWVLSSKTFRNYVDANNNGAFARLKDSAMIATRTNQETDDPISPMLNWLSKGLVCGNIAYRSTTALKQMLSVPAYFGYSQDPKYVSGLWKNMGIQYSRNMPAVLKTMVFGWGGKSMTSKAAERQTMALSRTITWALQNIPDFRERVTQGLAGMQGMSLTDSKTMAGEIVNKMMARGMYTNKLVDAITVAIGIKSIYDYEMSKAKDRAKEEAKAMGLVDQEFADHVAASMYEAEEEAKMKATLYYNATQQSNNVAFLSPFQTSRNFLAKMFTLYKNSPTGYARKLVESIRDLQRYANSKTRATMIDEYQQQNYEEGMDMLSARREAKKHLRNEARKSAFEAFWYGLFMNHIWNIGGKGLLGFMTGKGLMSLLLGNGDGDDDDERISDNLVYFSSLPMNAIPGMDIPVGMAQRIVNGQGVQNSAFESVLGTELGKTSREISKLAEDNGVLSPQMGWYIFGRAGRFAGMNPTILTNAYLGVERMARYGIYDGDEAKIDLMLLLQSPESNRAEVAKNLFKDRPLEEYLTCVERAMKYGTGDKLEGWITGEKQLTGKVEKQLIREFITNNMTDDERLQVASNKEMLDKIKNLCGEEEAKTLFESTTNPEYRKKIEEKLVKMGKDDPTVSDIAESMKRDMLGGKANDTISTGKELYRSQATTEDLMDDVATQKRMNEIKPIIDELDKLKKSGDSKGYNQLYRKNKKVVTEYYKLMKKKSTLNKVENAMMRGGNTTNVDKEKVDNARSKLN